MDYRCPNHDGSSSLSHLKICSLIGLIANDCSLFSQAVVATLWDCIDALCLCIRRGRDGIHPMGCLIFDLILFFGLGAMSGVIAHTVANLDDSGYYFAFFTDENGWEYLHVILGFGILAAYVIPSFLKCLVSGSRLTTDRIVGNSIIHLAIFVMACLAVKGLKKKQMPSPPPRIIYVRTDAHGNPIGDANQQYHMSELPTDDPPPGYSLPLQQGFMQNEDQIHREEPMVQGNVFKDKS